MKLIGQERSEADVKSLLATVDADKDGYLVHAEFEKLFGTGGKARPLESSKGTSLESSKAPLSHARASPGLSRGGFQAPFPPAMAHRLLLSAPSAAIE